MKKLLFLFLLLGLVPCCDAYYFGLKSADDTIANIQSIEGSFGVHLPLVSFIFDPREHYNVPAQLESMAEEL